MKQPKPGRPTTYKPEYVEQVQKLSALGAIDVDIADFFKVSLTTLGTWNTKYPEFRAAQKMGKEAANDRVEKSLYHKAVGYTYDAVKIFPPRGKSKKPLIVPYREHVPPETLAGIFWLKNRRSDEWRDRHDHTHGGTIKHQSGMTAAEMLAEIQQEAEALGLRLIPSDGDLVLEALPAPEPAQKAAGVANRGGNGTKK